MEWLERRITELQEAKDHKVLLEGTADEVFANLWTEVKAVVSVALQQRISLETNGKPLARVVRMITARAINSAIPESRELVIKLAEHSRWITAESDAGKDSFFLSVDSDGVVFLKFHDQPISAKDAAKEIMDAFLFGGQSPYRASNVRG